ncbi:MAG: signal peptidase I [Armatimonadetes bacterium]|nr:signal peptidase I [Armatimonadota bacterium]
MRRIARAFGYVLAFALLAFALWFYFTYRIGVVPSASMAPTLLPGDQYLINIRAYRHRLPERGDLIVFRSEEGDYLVKRVVGLPGEIVTIIAGQVYINGRPLYEPYLSETPQIEWPMQQVVPPDHVFVLGDNRNYSDDSRDFGPVPVDRILGRAEYVFYPSGRRHSLRAQRRRTEKGASPD